MKTRTLATLLTILISGTAGAEDAKDQVTSFLDEHQEDFSKVAMDIWEFAEVGYQEEKSSKLLQSKLQAAGFDVESGVAGMPTAFIASWGEGTPVIAILAEYDALPGLSQLVATERKDAGGPAGHACGHHLFGTASTAAAVAVKDAFTALRRKREERARSTWFAKVSSKTSTSPSGGTRVMKTTRAPLPRSPTSPPSSDSMAARLTPPGLPNRVGRL